MDEFIVGVLNAMDLSEYITGVTVSKLNQKKLREIKIPLSPLEIQKQLVAEAEKEEEIIASNRRLIEIMKRKIEEVLARI